MSAADVPADAAGHPPDAGAPVASESLAIPETILNPVTGQLVPTSDPKEVALAIVSLRDHKAAVDHLIGDFTIAAAALSRQQGTRTFHLPGAVATLSPDTEIEWDIAALEHGLLDAGCPQERLDVLIKTKVEYSVNASVAKQLSSANPDYKAAIEAAQRRVPKRPCLSVKPK